MWMRRVGLLIAAGITFWLFVFWPSVFLLAGLHKLNEYRSPKIHPDPVQQLAGVIGLADKVRTERKFYLDDGQVLNGQTNNQGFSVAVVGYDEAMSYTARDRFLNLPETITSYRKGKKLVLVYVLMANDSKDSDMETSAGYFSLKGTKHTYEYDIMAFNKLEHCNICQKKESVPPGESRMIVIPYDVEPEFDVSTMQLVYMPSLFTPSVYLPMDGSIAVEQ